MFIREIIMHTNTDTNQLFLSGTSPNTDNNYTTDSPQLEHSHREFGSLNIGGQGRLGHTRISYSNTTSTLGSPQQYMYTSAFSTPPRNPDHSIIPHDNYSNVNNRHATHTAPNPDTLNYQQTPPSDRCNFIVGRPSMNNIHQLNALPYIYTTFNNHYQHNNPSNVINMNSIIHNSLQPFSNIPISDFHASNHLESSNLGLYFAPENNPPQTQPCPTTMAIQSTTSNNYCHHNNPSPFTNIYSITSNSCQPLSRYESRTSNGEIDIVNQKILRCPHCSNVSPNSHFFNRHVNSHKVCPFVACSLTMRVTGFPYLVTHINTYHQAHLAHLLEKSKNPSTTSLLLKKSDDVLDNLYQKIYKKFCKHVGLKNESCLSLFGTKRALTYHENSHLKKTSNKTNLKSPTQQCPKCGIATTRLARHLMHVHSSYKPYLCDKCYFSSKSRSNLEKHKQCRHLTCDKCDFTFSNSKDLKVHREAYGHF